MRSLVSPNVNGAQGRAITNRMSVAPGVKKDQAQGAPPTAGDNVSLTGDTHVESKAPGSKRGWVAAAAATGIALAGVAVAQPAAAHGIQCGVQVGRNFNNYGHQINYSVNTCNGNVNWENQWTGEWGSYYDAQYDASRHSHGHHGHHHGGRVHRDHGHHGHHGHRGHNSDVEDALIGLGIGLGIGAIIFGN